MKFTAIALGLSTLLISFAANSTTRIKDITSLQNVRENQLVGYGLVVGLAGSGDSFRSSPFSEQAMQSMLERLGVNVRGAQLRPKNVAAVVVTADMPPFIEPGSRIDVAVSSLGDANSLMGGTLILTPLTGANGVNYAVAQGQVAVSGFAAQGRSEVLTQGVPTSARIPNGAIIERKSSVRLNEIQNIVLQLHNPDFNTSSRIANAINAFSNRQYRRSIASQIDQRAVRIIPPKGVSTAALMSAIGPLEVEPDTPARVIIDARSGTIVIGRDVRLTTAAVTHGSLTIRVTETPQVSQPGPLSNGETAVTSTTNISADETGGSFMIMQGPSLRALVRGLNQSGVKPNGIIAILQSLKTAGALHAELIVQQ